MKNIMLIGLCCAACAAPAPQVRYFDTQGRETDAAVMGGFYRLVLAKRSSGWLVQDFDSDGRARTAAYEVDEAGLSQWRFR